MGVGRRGLLRSWPAAWPGVAGEMEDSRWVPLQAIDLTSLWAMRCPVNFGARKAGRKKRENERERDTVLCSLFYFIFFTKSGDFHLRSALKWSSLRSVPKYSNF